MKNFLTCLLLLTTYTALAQNIPAAKEKQLAKRPLTFIENKGQVIDQYGHGRHDIQYKTGGTGMSIFVGNGQLHYQWSKALTKRKLFTKNIHSLREKPDTTPIQYSMYRLDMALEGANINAQVIASDKQPFYENYHTTTLHSGNTRACTYNKITYKNIYPHIDWTLYIKDNRLEYDLIVNPGGNVNDIKIKYNGATVIAHTDGNIKVITPLGDIKEQNLFAYEQTTNKQINAKFIVSHNTLAFTTGKYTGTLIIDPTLAWGTYYGGSGENAPFASTCDEAGNVWICGYTTSVSNIATIGSHQTTFNGFYDAFIVKFNGAGNMLWGAYYGGTNQDEAWAVAIDNLGNAYITGFTLSTTDMATPGAHQTTYMGGWDAFLAKFSSAGTMEWGTYYGGSYTDIGRGIACDTSNNIYISGETNSPTNIATPGTYQDMMGCAPAGNNAFLTKFNGSGLVVWGTYFGGNPATNDTLYDTTGNTALACVCDKNNNVYIGGTVWQNNITVTPGCYQDTTGGGWDCFITEFDSSCHLIWSTYYGGNGGDNATNLLCDDSLNLYVGGTTNSTNNIATPGANQTVYGGDPNDAFLVKFNDAGALQWGTYYGGNHDDECEGIAKDQTGHVYIAGLTSSTNNIATPGGYHITFQGGIWDAFLAEFSHSGTLLYGTYYGGSATDGANGVGCDSIGNIYLAGGTSSSSEIATPGSYLDIYTTDSGDAFLVKFDTGATSAVLQMQQINEVHLFPSPNDGNFTVSVKCSNNYNAIAIEILNVTGQLMYQNMATIQNGQLLKQINLRGITEGDYVMKLSSGNESKSIKFIIRY